MASSHGRQLSINLPCNNPSHGLQLFMDCFSMGLFPWSTVLQAQPTPAWVLHRVVSPTRKPAPAQTPLHGSAGSCQEPAPAWDSHGLTASFQVSTCSDMGLLHGLQVEICTPMEFHGLRVGLCIPMVLHEQGHSRFTMLFTQAASESPLQCLVLC